MTANKRRFLRTQPSILSLGSHYVGARIQGSLQVLDATSCHAYHSPE